MARASAINAVATALVTALNVPSVRALGPGGVYRNRPTAQTPPYISLGPSEETPADFMGTFYGSVVTVPIRVVTSGADADGESRALTILDACLARLDEPVALTVTGWTVMGVSWIGTRVDVLLYEDGSEGYAATGTVAITVRA
jgi:hypothetical protein